ncbi:hypothetical protein KH5H1_58400 [Corallococcus caeni]|nr:hypothetical protein KH5H1_58400 [Corallococcus sp. KH5-1]
MHALHELPGQSHRKQVPRERLHGRTRPVRGKHQERRRSRELLTPPRKLRLEHLPLEPLPLPRGEVRVLDGKWRERSLRAGSKGPVQGHQLAHEHPRGPAVRSDVVREHEQHVPRLLHPHEHRAEEGAPS